MQENLQPYISLLEQEELVAIPTETVYGLAADATKSNAVKKIFALKKRPHFNPLIAHISDIKMAKSYGIFSATAEKLAAHFWPGPLTLIVPQGEKSCSDLVTSGLNTIGLRIPKSNITQELIRLFGKPLAAPSANVSGTLSPTHPDHVRSSFGANSPVILDDGACNIGLESTIISILDDKVTLLRQGGISQSEIEDFLGISIHVQTNADDTGKVLSPGQLLRHYAPQKPIYLNQTECPDDATFIAFGTKYLPKNAHSLLQLSADEDLSEAASLLFSSLYNADKTTSTAIYIAPIPNIDIGIAINDRINRAKNK